MKEVYEAIMDPANASPLASLFTPVESIEATDERTLVLSMAHPYYEVVNVVKTGFWAIANIETRNELAEQYGQSGVDGTGPFLFGEWVPGSHVTVTRWEDYPGSIVPYFTNKGKAYLDGIRWETILEAAQRAVRIENAEIDTLRNPALQDVARLETNPDLSVSSFSEPSGYILSTNFERTDLDFHELTMRQAISHAIDRQAIVTALLADLGSPLYGPITPADVYYNPAVEEFNQFDLDRAKSMVAELGWTPGDDGILTKNGVRHAFSLTVQAESFNRDLASVLQASLAELGMEVTIEALDRGSYFGKLNPRRAPTARSSTTCGRCRSMWSSSLSAQRRHARPTELEPRQASGRRRGHRGLEAGGERGGAGGGGQPVPDGGGGAIADDPAGGPQQRLGIAAQRPRLAAAPVRHLPALQRCVVESK